MDRTDRFEQERPRLTAIAARVAAFFDGSAQATLPVLLDGRPASAWWHRGEARVVFDLEGDAKARFAALPED